MFSHRDRRFQLTVEGSSARSALSQNNFFPKQTLEGSHVNRVCGKTGRVRSDSRAPLSSRSEGRYGDNAGVNPSVSRLLIPAAAFPHRRTSDTRSTNCHSLRRHDKSILRRPSASCSCLTKCVRACVIRRRCVREPRRSSANRLIKAQVLVSLLAAS